MTQIINTLDVLQENNQEACETIKTTENSNTGKNRKLYIESYGCQMNFSDSEIVSSIMHKEGFDTTSDPDSADLIFLNTCFSSSCKRLSKP